MVKAGLSNLSVNFKVGYTYLEKTILQQFGSLSIPKLGDITLKNINITGSEDQVFIKVKSAGDFKGTIHVNGIIKLDESNQIISCDVQALDVKSDAFLYALGVRIFKSLLIKKVEELSTIKVEDLESMLKKAVAENTEKLHALDTFITADPIHLTVLNLKTKEDHVKLGLELKSKVKVELGKFKNKKPLV